MTESNHPLVRKAVALVTLSAFGLSASAQGATRFQRAPAPAPESSLQIQHDPVPCVNTDLAPKVAAAVSPGQVFDKGYVYFKAAGTEDYYYAVMSGAPENLEGLLPRPLPETKAIDYYVKAVDQQTLSKKAPQSGDYTPPVVAGSACKAKGVAVGKKGANLTIGLTREKQSPVPPGFRGSDIAKVILVTGAIVTLAAAIQVMGGTTAAGAAGAGTGAGAAGGISTGVLVGAGVAAAAGVAVAVGSGGSKTGPTPTPTPVVNRFIVAEATWSGTGDIDVQLIDPNGQPTGTRIPEDDCSKIVSRTERVILQGSSVPNGNYQVRLTGKSCGVGTPPTISTNIAVIADGVQKCSAFVAVPVPQTVPGCSFTIP